MLCPEADSHIDSHIANLRYLQLVIEDQCRVPTDLCTI